MVGHAALVGLLPLVTKTAQGFLHLAATDRLTIGALEQAFSLAHQLLTNLVCTPALPTFQLTRGRQSGVSLIFKLGINQLAELFQGVAQACSGTGAGFAMAFAHFLLNGGQRCLDRCLGL